MNEKLRWLWDAVCRVDTARLTELIEQDRSLLEARLSGNFTPLLWAAFYRNSVLVDCLIQMGARIDIITAVFLGRTGDVRTFLERQPYLARKHSPWGGYSLLHIAAAHGDLDMVQLFLSHGIDPNESGNPDHYSPLFFAHPPPYEKAELLLAHGADIRARAKHGFTVLHEAVKMNDEGWLKFLLRHGADRDAQTDARQSPWTIAIQCKNHRAAALLTEFSRNRQQEF